MGAGYAYLGRLNDWEIGQATAENLRQSANYLREVQPDLAMTIYQHADMLKLAVKPQPPQ